MPKSNLMWHEEQDTSHVRGERSEEHSTPANTPNAASSVGVVLLLFATLIGHGALTGQEAYSCVRSATFCLCEWSNPSVSAAGMSVLDACLYHRRVCIVGNYVNGGKYNFTGIIGHTGIMRAHERSSCAKRGPVDSDTGGVEAMEQASTAGLKSATSSQVLAIIQSLLAPDCATKVGENNEQKACVSNGHSVVVSGQARLDGSSFGVPLDGVLDAPVHLLSHAISGQGDDLRNLVQRQTAEAPRNLWSQIYRQLRCGGSGELSPEGLVSALRFAASVLLSPGVDVSELVLGAGEVADGGETDHDLLGIICGRVLARGHLEAVAQWPERQRFTRLAGGSGGGFAGLAAVVMAAVSILQASLSAEASREALLRMQQGMHTRGVVAAVLEAMRVLRERREEQEGRGGDGRQRSHDDNEQGREEDEESEGEGDGGREQNAVAAGFSMMSNALCMCVDILSRLVLLSSHFTLQFLEQGGLTDLVSAGALSGTSPPALVTGALVISSQLARASADNYARLRAVGVDASLPPLLGHSDPTVRAKACNLVGNLCRHSAYFYAAFLQNGHQRREPEPATATMAVTAEDSSEGCKRINSTVVSAGSSLAVAARENSPSSAGTTTRDGKSRSDTSSVVERLVVLCADPDAAARKFACFAVGNAAFHNEELYASLAPALDALVQALDDAEEKTRANAAGALGNLVRNSSALSGDLARCGGVSALLRVAARDTSASPRRIALFSLGTCCAYAPCRQALMTLLSGVLDDNTKVREEKRDAVGEGQLLGFRMTRRWDGERKYSHGGGSGDGQTGGGWSIDEETPAATAGFVGAERGGLGQRLERQLRELERDAVVGGDDVSRKYVVRLRTKLSGPPQP